MCVPQLPAVIGDAAVVAGIARQDHWELRGRRRSDRVTTVVNVDRRMRVVIPPRRPTPARSRRWVVVSTNRESAVVRIWSAARLDKLIGGEA